MSEQEPETTVEEPGDRSKWLAWLVDRAVNLTWQPCRSERTVDQATRDLHREETVTETSFTEPNQRRNAGCKRYPSGRPVVCRL
jgi:hypothetical protein